MSPRTRALAWAATLALPVLLAWHVREDGPGYRAGDHAQYLLHARALVEGRAYDDIGYIYTELNPVVGPRAYPPGLSFALAPLLALGDRAPAAIGIFLMLVFVAFVALAGRWAASREGTWAGMAVALLCGVSPELVRMSAFPVSDIPFCVLVLVVVLLADRPGAPSVGTLLGIAVAGSAAVAFRSIGVALVPALVLHGLLRGRREGWPFVLPAAACGMTFVAINAWLPTATSYMDQVSLSPLELLRMNVAKLYHYRLGLFDALLYPFPWNAANDVYHVIAVGLAAFGGWEWSRRSWRSFYPILALCYAVILIPYQIAVGRYLWPFLPLIAIAFVNGLRLVARRLVPSRLALDPGAAALLACAVLALPASALVARQVSLPSLPKNPDAREVFAFLLEEQRREPVRAVFFNPRVLAWETRIPAMPFVPGDPDAVVAELAAQRITYVVVDDFDLRVTGAEDVRRSVRERPERYAPLARFGGFAVYRFVAADGPAPSSTNTRSSRDDG